MENRYWKSSNVTAIGKTYKEMRNEPTWERTKKRDIEKVDQDYDEWAMHSNKSKRNPDPKRKPPRGRKSQQF